MPLITEDFLLENRYSRELYHEYAKGLPILDYHNHLSPEHLATDRHFESITQAWLAGDHYKWRAMRTLGTDEHYITGAATDLEKFRKWSACVPYTVRNPLYHWTHLELHRYFGWQGYLNEHTANEVYEHTSACLSEPAFGAAGLLRKMNVEVVCTTDDPADSLQWHQHALTSNQHPAMLPAFRPDRAWATQDPVAYAAYLDRLGVASGVEIQTLSDLLRALETRMDAFAACGCRISDHGLERMPEAPVEVNPEQAFLKVRAGYPISDAEQEGLTYTLLLELCRLYHKKGWVQQFHLGALRNTNSRLLGSLGPDTGFDSIGDFPQARSLAAFLDVLDATDQLPRTVLYTLNPAWNEVFATMAGNFNDGRLRGKVQFGSGWWYNDQLDGMKRQIDALSQMGLISCFIGMLTDSRSFLSFPRHEYFRRLLCQLFGSEMDRGLLPCDTAFIGGIIRDICYFNAKRYFGFEDLT